MGWDSTWSDILNGGNPRWKITCDESHQEALTKFKKYMDKDPSDTSIFCPLAGDDPFIYLLFKSGYSVTTIDLVPAAVEAMKDQFQTEDGKWNKEEDNGTIVWKHESGRATLMVGDALQRRPQLMNTFDAVYDKDSFGALPKQLRNGFCTRISEYMKSGGILYLECKLKNNHDEVKHQGPPFSLKEHDLMDSSCYGESFEHVKSLGSVYSLPPPMSSFMQQTGHILRRK